MYDTSLRNPYYKMSGSQVNIFVLQVNGLVTDSDGSRPDTSMAIDGVDS